MSASVGITGIPSSGQREWLVEWHDISALKQAQADLERSRENLDRERMISESRMSDMAMAVKGWLWETDKEGRFTFMSNSVEQYTGLTPEWHYGKTRRDLMGHPSDETDIAYIEKLQEERRPIEPFEFQRFGPNGPAWMRTSGIPYFGDDGEYLGYRGAAFNIDAEKRRLLQQQETEKKLADIQAQFLNAIRSIDSAFSIWDKKRQTIAVQR